MNHYSEVLSRASIENIHLYISYSIRSINPIKAHGYITDLKILTELPRPSTFRKKITNWYNIVHYVRLPSNLASFRSKNAFKSRRKDQNLPRPLPSLPENGDRTQSRGKFNEDLWLSSANVTPCFIIISWRAAVRRQWQIRRTNFYRRNHSRTSHITTGIRIAMKMYFFFICRSQDVDVCFVYENVAEMKLSGAGMSSLKRFYHRVKIRSRKINMIYKKTFFFTKDNMEHKIYLYHVNKHHFLFRCW